MCVFPVLYMAYLWHHAYINHAWDYVERTIGLLILLMLKPADWPSWPSLLFQFISLCNAPHPIDVVFVCLTFLCVCSLSLSLCWTLVACTVLCGNSKSNLLWIFNHAPGPFPPFSVHARKGTLDKGAGRHNCNGSQAGALACTYLFTYNSITDRSGWNCF